MMSLLQGVPLEDGYVLVLQLLQLEHP